MKYLILATVATLFSSSAFADIGLKKEYCERKYSDIAQDKVLQEWGCKFNNPTLNLIKKNASFVAKHCGKVLTKEAIADKKETAEYMRDTYHAKQGKIKACNTYAKNYPGLVNDYNEEILQN